MKNIQFSTHIQAPASTIWKILWEDTTYRHWTSVYSVGSHAVGEWKEGAKIKFLGPGGSGGISSVIETMRENEYMVFKHLREISGGVELPASGWEGAMETYKLTPEGDGILLTSSMDCMPDFEPYFTERMPQALNMVKALAEEVIKPRIFVSATVKGTSEQVWASWTEPAHITKWCFATPEWHAPRATNDLRTGGEFVTRMEAKDGSVGFDMTGTYTTVLPLKRIAYVMSDGRKVDVLFNATEEGVYIVESFEPENVHGHDLQRNGWQAILDNFKTYTEKA